MLVAPNPTPVASGLSPVTAGDLAYVVKALGQLSDQRVHDLAAGSLSGPDDCGVCWALRRKPERYSEDEKSVAERLLAWHGNDALRCGVIYGVAAAAPSEERP